MHTLSVDASGSDCTCRLALTTRSPPRRRNEVTLDRVVTTLRQGQGIRVPLSDTGVVVLLHQVRGLTHIYLFTSTAGCDIKLYVRSLLSLLTMFVIWTTEAMTSWHGRVAILTVLAVCSLVTGTATGTGTYMSLTPRVGSAGFIDHPPCV